MLYMTNHPCTKNSHKSYISYAEIDKITFIYSIYFLVSKWNHLKSLIHTMINVKSIIMEMEMEMGNHGNGHFLVSFLLVYKNFKDKK